MFANYSWNTCTSLSAGVQKPCTNDGIPFCPYDYLCQLWQRIPGEVFSTVARGIPALIKRLDIFEKIQKGIYR